MKKNKTAIIIASVTAGLQLIVCCAGILTGSLVNIQNTSASVKISKVEIYTENEEKMQRAFFEYDGEIPENAKFAVLEKYDASASDTSSDSDSGLYRGEYMPADSEMYRIASFSEKRPHKGNYYIPIEYVKNGVEGFSYMYNDFYNYQDGSVELNNSYADVFLTYDDVSMNGIYRY